MRFLYTLLSIVTIPIVFVLPQRQIIQRTHNFSGTLPITLGGSFTVGQTDYKSYTIGLGAFGMAEYFFSTNSPTIYGFRLTMTGQALRGQDNSKTFPTPTEFQTDLLILSGGITAGYSFNDKLFPYIYGGVSNIWFSPKDSNGARLINNQNGVYSRTAISYDGEFGARIVLNEVLSVFLGVGIHFPQTDYLDDITRGSFNDFYYSGKVGISLSLFGHTDFDGDGITDSEDACPSNPEDFDGFQDEDGCPDHDNDKDGIYDELDKCPNDPEDFDGFQDSDGCPDMDNDGDGIPDIKDKCPNQPENYNDFEDSDGCPDILGHSKSILDSDKDGIPDSIDNCPDQAETLNGFNDDDGCPDTVAVQDTSSAKEIILEGIKLFDWNSSEIKPTAFEELDKVVELLLIDPFIKWAIESYTDNNSDQDSLKSLSQQRGISAVRYFINKGLPSFMFKIFSKGPESPVADNNTLEGRMKNNRIVIKRLK